MGDSTEVTVRRVLLRADAKRVRTLARYATAFGLSGVVLPITVLRASQQRPLSVFDLVVFPLAWVLAVVVFAVVGRLWAVGSGRLAAALVTRRGDSVRIRIEPTLGRPRVVHCVAGDHLPLGVWRYSSSASRRNGRPEYFITLGERGSRWSMLLSVATTTTDWSAWALELGGEDFVADVTVGDALRRR